MLTVDWDALRTSSMADPELAIELIELFLSDTPIQLESLRGCVDQSNSEATRRFAHQIKGSCLVIGAERMAHLCEELETAGESQSVEDLPRLSTLVFDEFVNAATQLRDGARGKNLFADAVDNDPESQDR